MAKKIRLHEIAKDYQVPAKYICQILDKNRIPYKNNMQVLDDRTVEIIKAHISNNEEEYAAKRAEYTPQKFVTIVSWSDEDYYVIQLLTSQVLTREVLVSLCSETEKYYTDHESAWNEASQISKKKYGNREIKEISIDDYPIPEDTETIYDFIRR